MAKSTFCRKCSEYFAITPAVLARAAAPVALKAPPVARKTPADVWASAPVTREPARTGPSPAASQTVPAAGGGLRDRLGGLLGSKPKTRNARCFECTSWA